MTRLTIERALSAERYELHLKALGYRGEEVTLVMIGFFAGWDALEIGLEKVLEAVREQAKRDKG